MKMKRSMYKKKNSNKKNNMKIRKMDKNEEQKK